MNSTTQDNKTRFGLFSRMLVAMFVMLLASLTILSYTLLQNAASQFDKFRLKNAKSLAHTLAEGSLDALITEDYEILERFVNSSLPSHHGAYVYITRTNGQILSSTDQSLVAISVIPPKITEKYISRSLSYNNRPVIEVVNKIIVGQEHLANAHIAYYTDEGHFQFLGQAQNIIAALILLLIVILVGTYLIVSRLRNPILSLINTVVNTNFNTPFSLPDKVCKRNDEVGVLARTFDDVYNRLFTANQKTQQIKEKLEENVEKRTQQLADINEELFEEKKHIDTIINNAGDSIVTVNEKGLIETFNNAAQDLFGYSADETKGQNITLLMPESYHQQHSLAFNKYVTASTPPPLNNEAREVKGKRKDGSEFSLELKLNYIELHGNKLFIGILRDVTLQKQTKESLERSNELLEEKVRERTEELNKINQELVSTRDAALDASKIKSEFLSTISHELRTPLHAITGYENILSMTELTEDQAKYCSQINIGAQNLLEIINEILDFSAFESGKLKIENDTFSVSAIINDICNMFKLSAEKKGIKLSCNINKDVPTSIFSDITRLRQTIVNLVSNAIKFTENGSVTINVSLSNQYKASQDNELLISVKDTGIGIDENQYQKIFSPFYQVDGSVTRSYGGTGIGLAMSKNIIELMGGHISLNSQTGQGSTFTITLPLVTNKAHKSQEDITQVNTIPEIFRTPKNYNITESNSDKKILIVEDNEVNAELLTIFINENGYNADIAENGSVFLDMVSKNNYDLVFMDCQMPILNGYDATTQYRQSETSGQHLPIIAVTANAMIGDREKCIASGMDDYIEKPVKPERIKEAIQNWLKIPQKIA